MPKKTKKEKHLADLRRKQSFVPIVPTPSYQFSSESTDLVASPPRALPHQEEGQFVLIRKDIVKTLLLGAATIGTELTLYGLYR